MLITFFELQDKLKNILIKYGFSSDKAEMCAQIFAGNSRDGVSSHGLNRFPAFIYNVRDGLINVNAEPVILGNEGVIERWDGDLGSGMYIATLATERAIKIASENGMGCVAVKNTNHWMRGGTYGWQAAEAGCIAICATNTIGNMPAWGGTEPRVGNNPLVIAVPRKAGHVVLDMAMSQFSYGKLQEYQLAGKELPVAGGYDKKGQLTTDPGKIRDSQRPLPIGYWKGSGLSIMIDLLVAGLSGGRTVGDITGLEKEYGLSQIFICINAKHLSPSIIENIISFTKGMDSSVRYPGEQVLATRRKSLQEGVLVDDTIWEQVLAL
jgi:3-dehydro-L-gulonate 2-dehydrogenase